MSKFNRNEQKRENHYGVNHNIIRTNGTSVGSKKSGHFMNTKTKNKYLFYLTGKDEQVYFEIGDKKYLVDDLGE